VLGGTLRLLRRGFVGSTPIAESSSCVRTRGSLLRLLHEPQMTGHLGPAARRREKEPQRRHSAVHRRRLYALLALANLERAQILVPNYSRSAFHRVRGAREPGSNQAHGRRRPETRVLRVVPPGRSEGQASTANSRVRAASAGALAY